MLKEVIYHGHVFKRHEKLKRKFYMTDFLKIKYKTKSDIVETLILSILNHLHYYFIFDYLKSLVLERWYQDWK
jgi:hypothetical protein